MITWRDTRLAEWQAAAAAFAQGRLGAARRGPETHAAPAFGALLAEMQALGLAALCADEAQDGLGQDEAALAAVLLPLCAVDASAGAAVYATGAAHLALRQCGVAPDAALAGQWLAWPAFHDLAEQDWPQLTAAGHLQGHAELLLIGAHAGFAVLPARTAEGTALVLIDLKAPGAVRSDAVRTLGLSACGLIDLTCQAVPVCARAPLPAAAWARLQERLAVPGLAMLCGVMQGSEAAARAYAGERHQGGGPIRDWGEVRRLLALMQQQLATVAALLQQAVEPPAGACTGRTARLAQLQAGELACRLTADGVQLLGGNGYMKDYGQEKRLRDAWQLHSLGGSVAWRRQQLVAT